MEGVLQLGPELEVVGDLAGRGQAGGGREGGGQGRGGGRGGGAVRVDESTFKYI